MAKIVYSFKHIPEGDDYTSDYQLEEWKKARGLHRTSVRITIDVSAIKINKAKLLSLVKNEVFNDIEDDVYDAIACTDQPLTLFDFQVNASVK